MYGPYDHNWVFHGGGMFFGDLAMPLIWGILLLTLFALLKYLFGKPGGEKGAPRIKTSLDILKEAYVRGAISREEYLQKRDDLTEK